MRGNIHARLGHDFHGVWIEDVRFHTRGPDVDLIGFEMTRPSFGHLTPARVAGAEKDEFESGFR